MPYTFVPKEKHARAYGNNLRISRKSAVKICRVISKKPLTRAKRLLNDLLEGRRSLQGKYHSKTAAQILQLLESCEKNADDLELDSSRLMVHASAHKGPVLRRRRRKAAFGSRLKSTNLEVLLIEKGREKKVKFVRGRKDLEKVVKEVAQKVAKEKQEVKSQHEIKPTEKERKGAEEKKTEQ